MVKKMSGTLDSKVSEEKFKAQLAVCRSDAGEVRTGTDTIQCFHQ